MSTQASGPSLLSELSPDYFEPSYLRRLQAMVSGLRHPRSSREYKAAVIEMQRLSAPIAAVLLPLLAVGLILLAENDRVLQDRVIVIEVLEADTEPILKTIDAPLKPDSHPDDLTADTSFSGPSLQFNKEVPVPDQQVSPLPNAPLDRVIMTKSGALFRRLCGDSRDAGMRVGLLARNGGDPLTEDAVLRALRWLKMNQQADGSWMQQKIAMTGLAILTFLAHDERPGYSAEFGDAVQRALEFLIRSQREDGRFTGVDGNEYAHPIAAYALCEAYGMTLNPNVKSAAERALVPIVRGQHPTGGWDYRMDPNVNKESGTYRDDTSYMGWCAQALKAAKLAQLQAEGLEKAIKLSVRGFKKNANPKGGFGYTAPGEGGLTSVGTLCMQLLGASNEPEVKASLDLMRHWQPSFAANSPVSGSLQYTYYYATQAKFHAGGKQWEDWNKEMIATYLKAQQIDRGTIKDDKGNVADVGWWINGDAHTDRPVMDTCLAALQLMVYYRNLPTTSTAAVKAPAETMASPTEKGDIPVLSLNL